MDDSELIISLISEDTLEDSPEDESEDKSEAEMSSIYVHIS